MTAEENAVFEQMRDALRDIMQEKQWLPAFWGPSGAIGIKQGPGWFIPDTGVMGRVRDALEAAESITF